MNEMEVSCGTVAVWFVWRALGVKHDSRLVCLHLTKPDNVHRYVFRPFFNF